MSATMRALVWHGRGDVRLDTVPTPEPGPGQSLVEVALCGLCGSDRRQHDVGPIVPPKGAHPLTGHIGPVTLGHEIIGRVVRHGASVLVDLVAPGSRVAVEPTWSCGTCAACRRGESQLCAIAGCVGLSSHGGLAPYVVVPTAGLVPVPDHVVDEEAALAEPLAVGLHALDRGGLRAGESVVVSGHGPIGAAVVALALAAGAGPVTVLEPSPQRRRVALALGAAAAVDPGTLEEPSDVLRELRSSADLGVDCSGAPGSLDALLGATRLGARIVVPAVSGGTTPVSMSRLVMGQRSIVGSLGYRGDVARVVAMLNDRRIDLSAFTTQRLGLPDVAEWFAQPIAEGAPLKVLVDPQS